MSWRPRLIYEVEIAVAATVAAYALQRAFWSDLPHAHLFFYPAVFVAGRLAGARSGVLCTVLSAATIAVAFLPPFGALAVTNVDDLIDLGIFGSVGVAVSVTLGRLHAAVEKSREAEAEAKRARIATEAVWSMIAHDVRTPLSVITLSSQELARLDRTDVARVVEIIQRSADRASDLLADALVASRAAAGELPIVTGSCDVEEVCATALDAVRPLARSRGVALVDDVAPDLTVRADARRIVQVLTNLMVNAVKVSRSGSRVALHAHGDGAAVEMVVEDHGPGIAPEKLSAIFTKFWADGPAAGTGLGLWIARALVEAHRSQLEVASEVGQGTSFSFRLPRMDRRGSTRPAAGTPDQGRINEGSGV